MKCPKLGLVSVFVLGGALGACGGDGVGDESDNLGPNVPGQQPATNPSSPGTPASTPAACSFTQTLDGASIVKDVRTQTAPALGGGALADGVYVLTQYQWVDPAGIHTLHSRRIVLEVSGGGTVGQYLWHRNSETEQRYLVKLTTTGERIALHSTYPSGRTLEWDRFQASGNSLVLFSSSDQKVATFVRR